MDSKLEGRLMDGLITAFHEHTGEDAHTMLNAFGTIINALGARAK